MGVRFRVEFDFRDFGSKALRSRVQGLRDWGLGLSLGIFAFRFGFRYFGFRV